MRGAASECEIFALMHKCGHICVVTVAVSLSSTQGLYSRQTGKAVWHISENLSPGLRGGCQSSRSFCSDIVERCASHLCRLLPGRSV